MSMKNSNDTIGNRTRDLQACSTVPQQIAPPRAPIILVVMYNIRLISRRSEFLLVELRLLQLLFILPHPLFRIYMVSGN
jgi:hypothetical protein